ncbi:fatty acid desaturase [Colwellia sp. 12G3]|uniref:fatty acid desaturase n=1 Tax=Colwellia sp. 12G3 TaxID=2058299 RepID=UPI0018E351A4|nr:fatty acid desaturase [Colwellia sp. 12G3]
MLVFYLSGLAFIISSTLGYLYYDLPYFIMFIVNGAAMIVMFGTIHEAAHASVSRISWINDWIGTIGAFLYFPGLSTPIYRYLHLSHHRYTGDPQRDPDVKYVNDSFLRCLLRWTYQDIYWGAWVARNFSTRTTQEKRYFIGGTIIYLTWYTAWLMSPWANEFILLYLLPQRVAYAVLLYFFSYVQHPPGILQADNPFQATVRLNVEKWLQPFILYQDKHFIHHLFPKLPFYRYQKIWRFAQEILEQQQVPMRNIIESSWDKVEINLSSTCYVSITEINKIAEDTLSYKLVSNNGKALPAFSAGAHIDVHITDRLTRQYSITNLSSSTPDHYLIAVKCEQNGRGGSAALHESFKLGNNIKISTPRDNFNIDITYDNYQLIAGGIGITPILSMAHYLNHLGKPFHLHLFSRNQSYLPFIKEIQKLSFFQQVTTYFDDEMPIFERDIAALLGSGTQNKGLYICGPEKFMDYMINTAKEQHWQANNIHFERFSAKTIDTSNDKAFEIVLKKSAKTLYVPADQSILNILESNNISVPTSCEQGLCGSCVCKVISGKVSHRDSILTEEDHQKDELIAVCVSRATSQSLVLDL